MRTSRLSTLLPFGFIAAVCLLAIGTKALMTADLAFFSDEKASQGILIGANKDNIVICIGGGTFPITDSTLANDTSTQFWIYQYTGKEPPFSGKYFLSDAQKAAGTAIPPDGSPLTIMEKGFIYYIHSDRDLHFRCGDGLSENPFPGEDDSQQQSSASSMQSSQAGNNCTPVDCAAPADGCRYVNATHDANGCPTSCGTLQCGDASASSAPDHGAAPSLSVTSLIPSTGPTGTRVIVNGTGFAPTGNIVHFADSTFDNLDSPDGSSLLFTVPDHNEQPCMHSQPPCETNVHLYPAGQYPVSVQVGNDTSNTLTFTITSAASSASEAASSASSTAFGAHCTNDNDCPMPLCAQPTSGPSFCGQPLKCINGTCQVDTQPTQSSSAASIMSCTNGQTAVPSFANTTLDGQLPTHTDQILFADFNKDGKTDMAYRVNGDVTVLQNTGNGFQQIFAKSLGNGTSANMAIGDVNNDGYPDVVVAATNFSSDMGSIGLTVLLNDTHGGFQYPNSLSLPYGSNYITGTSLSIYQGDILAEVGGNPLSGKLSRIHVNHFSTVMTKDITVTDFPVSAFQSVSRSQWIYAGLYNQNAPVLFQLVPESRVNDIDLWVAGQNLGPVLGGASRDSGLGKQAWMSVGDINGDGLADIAIATRLTDPAAADTHGIEGDVVYWMQNNGYGKPWTIHILSKTLSDAQRTGVAIGDGNGDGIPDVIATGWNGATLYAQGAPSCTSIPSSTDFDLAGSTGGSPSSASSAATSALTITSLSPMSGPQGTSITITGTGFAPTGNVVHINGTTMTVGSADGTHITANNTYTNGTGMVPVYVTIGNTTSNAVNFTVTANASSQSSTPPAPAPISIEQTGFHLIKNGAYTDTTFKVTNTGTGTFATTFFNAGTQIGMDEQISAAAVNGQIVDCSTVPYTTSFKSVDLTSCYGSGPTGIGSLAAGQSMLIDIERKYTNYCNNNVPQQGWFAFYAYYVYPGHSFGKTAPLTSEGCAGTPSPDDGTSPFGANSPTAAPVVTSVSPLTATPGELVTIQGSGFGSLAHVVLQSSQSNDIGLYSATDNGTVLQFLVPTSINQGAYSVLVRTDTATSNAVSGFAIQSAAAPIVTGFSPSAVAQGDIVTIKGSGFGQGYNIVYFGSIAVHNVPSTDNGTTIQIGTNDIPPGTYDVSVGRDIAKSNSIPGFVIQASAGSSASSADLQTQSSASSIFFGYDPNNSSAPSCTPIDCAQPPMNCRYVNPTRDANGCPTSCGTLSCSPSSFASSAPSVSTTFQVTNAAPTTGQLNLGGAALGKWTVTASQHTELRSLAFNVDTQNVGLNPTGGVQVLYPLHTCTVQTTMTYYHVSGGTSSAAASVGPLIANKPGGFQPNIGYRVVADCKPDAGSLDTSSTITLFASGMAAEGMNNTLGTQANFDTQSTTWLDYAGNPHPGLGLSTANIPSSLLTGYNYIGFNTSASPTNTITSAAGESFLDHVFNVLASLFNLQNITASLLHF